MLLQHVCYVPARSPEKRSRFRIPASRCNSPWPRSRRRCCPTWRAPRRCGPCTTSPWQTTGPAQGWSSGDLPPGAVRPGTWKESIKMSRNKRESKKGWTGLEPGEDCPSGNHFLGIFLPLLPVRSSPANKSLNFKEFCNINLKVALQIILLMLICNLGAALQKIVLMLKEFVI